MTYAYFTEYGPKWLNKVVTSDKLALWDSRASEEARTRGTKGVASVANTGLSYANFYDLTSIAAKHWEPLAPALGKKVSILSLLDRFENLRNPVGHNRPLLPFEKDLMSGIAGQIRNQVTIFMSAQDEAGDFYPRIESIMDGFGRRIECSVVEGEIAGSVRTHDIIVHPGETVAFECVGTDPQNRDLKWTLYSNHAPRQTLVAPSGVPTTMVWKISEDDVRENAVVEIFLAADLARFHRFGTWDHRSYFTFRVGPPT